VSRLSSLDSDALVHERLMCYDRGARARRGSNGLHRVRRTYEAIEMAKGQQKPKTNNKPKLTTKEKKQKKKEKVKARNA
jgi:hypothetical protein